MFIEDVQDDDTTTDTEAEDTSTDELETKDSDNDSTGKDETPEKPESEDKSSKRSETPEQRRARIKRQYEREFGKQAEKGSEEGSKENDEKYNRLVLRYEGYKDKAEQDEIISYANWKGVDIEEALKAPVVQSAIKEIRDKKSVPEPSVRTSKSGTVSVDTLVTRYKAGKYLTPQEMAQVRKKLRG